MKPILLNEFEVITLNIAYNRIKEEREDKPFIQADWKACKKNLPTLIQKGFVHKDTLRYAGMIVLTDKGIEAAKKLDNEINQ